MIISKIIILLGNRFISGYITDIPVKLNYLTFNLSKFREDGI